MTAVGIILILLGLLLAFISILLAIIKKESLYYLGILLLMICIPGLACLFPTPTDNDVKKGTAEYRITVHTEKISSDSTNIWKTYKLVWKDEYPWGRPK